MKNIKIYPIIIIASLLLALYLPKFYKDMFAKRVDSARIFYSSLDEEFLKMSKKTQKRKREFVYSNIDGTKEFSEKEFRIKQPFVYYKYLINKDEFPSKFMAYAQTPNIIAKEKSSIEISPKAVNTKGANLYPLFESTNPRLPIPDDVFRLGKEGITFIISSENKIDVKKSKLFNDEFKRLGASFPLKEAFGFPTNRKPFDEGYFIRDSKDNFFHLKQEEGKPFLNKLETNGIKIKYILVKEDTRKEYYGLVVDEEGSVYLLMYGEYELLKLPIEKYNYKTQKLVLRTNPVNRVIWVSHTDYEKQKKVTKTYVTNLDYELKKENLFSYSIKQYDMYEKVKSLIFPYKLALLSSKESYISFELKEFSLKSFIIYGILSLLFLTYVKLSNRKLKDHLLAALFIVLGGIYSILSLILFNKFLVNTFVIKKKEKN